MVGLRFQRPLTGLEISGTHVKMVQIVRGKRGWKLKRCVTVPFPEETLKLSYRTENINDPAGFMSTVSEAMSRTVERTARIGLSIPNEIVKVSIQGYEELPKTRTDTEKMISWQVKRSLPFPVERTKISYHILRNGPGREKRLMVILGFQDVLREYESNLKEMRLFPEVIRPAGINHFNFFSERLPRSGTVGFLGLFESFFTFFVSHDGELVFYHGVKKGFFDVHFFQDVEMTVQLYQKENPDRDLERFYYASQVGFYRELEEGLRSISRAQITRMGDEQVASLENPHAGCEEDVDPSRYVAAVGAAQSLMSR